MTFFKKKEESEFAHQSPISINFQKIPVERIAQTMAQRKLKIPKETMKDAMCRQLNALFRFPPALKIESSINVSAVVSVSLFNSTWAHTHQHRSIAIRIQYLD